LWIFRSDLGVSWHLDVFSPDDAMADVTIQHFEVNLKRFDDERSDIQELSTTHHACCFVSILLLPEQP
jgi:hypothetical protein